MMIEALWCSLVASVEEVVAQRVVEQLVVELDRAGVEQLYQYRSIRPPQQQVLHGCNPRWCRPDEEEERSMSMQLAVDGRSGASRKSTRLWTAF